VAPEWDRHTEQSLALLQDDLVRQQVSNFIAPFSPLWRGRLADLDREPSSVRSVADLETLPAIGERDVSPNGDPAGMLALVLEPGGSLAPVAAAAPETRRAFRRRGAAPEAAPTVVDVDQRSTSYVFAGLGFRYPLGSTRGDLDVIARAGARLWAVLGLTRDDVLLSAVPPGATTEHVSLQGAALAAGAPAIFPGENAAAIAAAARLVPPTVIALPAGTAPLLLSGVTDLGAVRTLLLVGAPSEQERVAAAYALSAAGGAADAVVLAVHAPSGARVLWGECRESGGTTGLHTYPDLDVAQLVDAETGGPATAGGELVLTQLGLRGSALLRWRTGDVVSGVSNRPCPSCGRVVPRVKDVQRAALIARLESGRSIDLRAIAGVLSRRSDVVDWRVVVGPRRRDGAMSVVVHFSGFEADNPQTVISVATNMRAAAGRVPTQLVATDRAELSGLSGVPLSPRILLT
jgi:phenylacetate-coenzyme A ligase PaaK-like adenylate-forming protein